MRSNRASACLYCTIASSKRSLTAFARGHPCSPLRCHIIWITTLRYGDEILTKCICDNWCIFDAWVISQFTCTKDDCAEYVLRSSLGNNDCIHVPQDLEVSHGSMSENLSAFSKWLDFIFIKFQYSIMQLSMQKGRNCLFPAYQLIIWIEAWSLTIQKYNFIYAIFTCVSYAEARNRYRLDVRLSVRPSVRPSVCLSVRHTLVLYQNGWTYCHDFFTTW